MKWGPRRGSVGTDCPHHALEQVVPATLPVISIAIAEAGDELDLGPDTEVGEYFFQVIVHGVDGHTEVCGDLFARATGD